MSIGGAMRRPRWLRVRKTRELAEQAEAARDKVHQEVIAPLRQMRSGDYLAPAIAEQIRRHQNPG